MARQKGIHDENVEIRSMIGNNQIRPFWKFHFSHAMHPDETQNSHRITPNHINRETPFPPRNARQRNANKRVEKQQGCYEDQPDVQLIT